MIRLYHGDCLTVMKELPEQSVDLILCDLPYGCGKTKHKWDREIELTELWKGYKRLMKRRYRLLIRKRAFYEQTDSEQYGYVSLQNGMGKGKSDGVSEL